MTSGRTSSRVLGHPWLGQSPSKPRALPELPCVDIQLWAGSEGWMPTVAPFLAQD